MKLSYEDSISHNLGTLFCIKFLSRTISNWKVIYNSLFNTASFKQTLLEATRTLNMLRTWTGHLWTKLTTIKQKEQIICAIVMCSICALKVKIGFDTFYSYPFKVIIDKTKLYVPNLQ